MYKVAGELTSDVIQVTARAIPKHALSILGDHSDVMTAPRDRARDAPFGFSAGGRRQWR